MRQVSLKSDMPVKPGSMATQQQVKAKKWQRHLFFSGYRYNAIIYMIIFTGYYKKQIQRSVAKNYPCRECFPKKPTRLLWNEYVIK